jgi:hypothetical protein
MPDESVADAQLMVVDIIEDTLRWVFVEDRNDLSEEERESQMSVLRNLADLIVTDLGLTVTAVEPDGNYRALLILADPAQEDSD